jgi:hypothetical protein
MSQIPKLAMPVMLMGLAWFQPLHAGAQLVLEEGFETRASLYDGDWWTRSGNDQGRISRDVAREGEASARFEVELTDDGDYRSELAAGKAHPCLKHFLIGEEYWYGISIRPDPALTASPYGEIVFQFHSTPDNVPGETWTTGLNPPIALSCDGNTWQLSVRGDDKEVTTRPHYLFSHLADLGAVEKGQWTDWVFHIKWNYDGNGFTRVWKNGEFVLNLNGPNCFNDQVGPYLKFGVYAWYLRSPEKETWKKSKAMGVKTRIYYHDVVRIADGRGSFAQVAPRGVNQHSNQLEALNWKAIAR